MKITTHTNPLSKQETYQIIIEDEDNAVIEDIAECFTKQYPKQLAVVISKEIKAVEIKIVIIGLK